MYKCQLCSKTVPPRTTQEKVIKSKRSKIYTYFLCETTSYGLRRKFITEDKELVKSQDFLKSNKVIRSWTTSGWEIEKELIACKECIKN